MSEKGNIKLFHRTQIMRLVHHSEINIQRPHPWACSLERSHWNPHFLSTGHWVRRWPGLYPVLWLSLFFFLLALLHDSVTFVKGIQLIKYQGDRKELQSVYRQKLGAWALNQKLDTSRQLIAHPCKVGQWDIDPMWFLQISDDISGEKMFAKWRVLNKSYLRFMANLQMGNDSMNLNSTGFFHFPCGITNF